MQRNQPQHPILLRQSSRGFTVLEVLVAMGIFAIGFAAAAALFPAAINLQKQAMDDAQGENIKRSVKALLQARKFDDVADLAGCGPDLRVYPLPDMDDGNSANDRWKLPDRSYPTQIIDARQRKYYWVPVVQRAKFPTAINEWKIFTFILRRDIGTTDYTTPVNIEDWANPDDPSNIPRVGSLEVSSVSGGTFTLNYGFDPNHPVQVGDQILDSNGVTYTVKSITGTTQVTVDGTIPTSGVSINRIWYAPPSSKNSPSPTLHIVPAITSAVE